MKFDLGLFDLNLLKALDALVGERKVTRAAARLNVTQQAMSGSLKRLREHFADELLVRVGRHLELTPQAAALVGPVREVILQIGIALGTNPTFDPDTACRHFSVVMSDYATITVLPHLMARLANEAPGIVLDVRLIDHAVFRNLEAGELDLCLLPSNWRLYQEEMPAGVRSLTLFKDDFVCVVDANNPQVGETIDRQQYLDMHHTMLRLGGGVRSIVEKAWNDHGIAPQVAAMATNFATLVVMVPGTPLIATVQRRLANFFARVLPIRILECPVPIDELDADLNWHVRNELDPAHAYLRDAFARAGAEMRPHKSRL